MLKGTISMKELIKSKNYKDAFKCRAYVYLKVSDIDETGKDFMGEEGKNVSNVVKLEIFPRSGSKFEDLFKEKIEPPTPPVESVLIDDFGNKAKQSGMTAAEARKAVASGKYRWQEEEKTTDKKYQKELKKYIEYIKGIRFLQIFGMNEEYGITEENFDELKKEELLKKIDDFNKIIADLGFSEGHDKSITEAIEKMDHFQQPGE